MSSLLSLLPKPKSSTNASAATSTASNAPKAASAPSLSTQNPPHPRTNQIALIPNTSAQIAHIDDISQKVALQGHREGKIVYASFEDVIEKYIPEEQLRRPSEEEQREIAQETQLALQDRVQQRIKTAYKLDLKEQQKREDQVDFVKYTPLNPITGASGQTKIIRITEEERDPMEPSRFKNKKLPDRPPSPPVPILKAPAKKLTAEDSKAWKIPPCVSNWKNKKGYVIPLDKRMAVDGRGTDRVQINDRFGSLAQAVYSTERSVREEIEQRKEYQRAVERKLKEQEEEEMRRLAEEAKMAYIPHEDLEGYREREEIRKQVREETFEEHRKEALRRKKAFYQDEEDDDDRDVSERVSLGHHAISAGGSRAGFDLDSRLEQHASSDLTSGFGDDDDYNVYDKPLVNQSSESVLYRPRQQNLDMLQGDAEELAKSARARFTRASFAGNGGEARESGGAVSFQREQGGDEKNAPPQDEFSFLIGGANNDDNKRKRGGTLDHIGRGGFMRATGGGSSNDLDHYRASKRQRVEFSRSTTQQ